MSTFFSALRGVVRDMVFGMQDGLISNLGLVLGVWQGGGGQFAIILAGLASMFAGAFSMATGSYLSAKSQREVYEHEIKSTAEQLEKNPKACVGEIKSILHREGLGEREINLLFKKSKKYSHPKFICNYLVQRKVGISQEKFDSPVKNALAMLFSFLLGSLVPILPFILLPNGTAAVLASILTIIALFFLGWAKTHFTKLNPFKSGLEVVLIGVGSGIIGYIVGYILNIVG